MTDTLAKRIEEVQRKVAAGEIDLRPIGEALFGKWDQDYLAEILSLALAACRSPSPDVAVLREALEPFQRDIPEYDDREFTTITVRVSDLRRARQALAGAREVDNTAAFKNTDDAKPVDVIEAVLHCASSWDGNARIIGNVRAKDIVRALMATSAGLCEQAITIRELRDALSSSPTAGEVVDRNALVETPELVEKVARAIAVYDANNPHGSLEGRARAAIRAMLSSAPSAVDRRASPPDLEGVLSELRSNGLTVAVHNDYRLNGEAHTFWLFTTPDGRAIKGEGKTDTEALEQIRTALSSLPNSPGGVGDDAQKAIFELQDRVSELEEERNAMMVALSWAETYEPEIVEEIRSRALATAPTAEGKLFRFHWRDGKIDEARGAGEMDALSRLGFGAGELPALDYWELVIEEKK